MGNLQPHQKPATPQKLAIPKTAIAYNPQAHLWEARNGQSYSDRSKKKVLLWALQHDHPTIYRLVWLMCCAASIDGNARQMPQGFLDRILKGAMLYTKGKINLHNTRIGYECAHVSSQSNATRYLVTHTATGWKCDCEDFSKGAVTSTAYGVTCKHILAVMIALGAQAPTLQREDEGFQGFSELQAKRATDLEYLNALGNAAQDGGESLFWYYYQEVLSLHTRQLYQNAQDILGVNALRGSQVSDPAKEITAQEIRSWTCNEFIFERFFEIPELNGEDYGNFWMWFYEHSRNGAFSRLKAELICTFEELL